MVGTMVSGATQAESFLAALTPLEREVADQMAEGCANSEIARRLFWSNRSVENRVSVIYEKLPEADWMDRRVQVVLLVLLATSQETKNGRGS